MGQEGTAKCGSCGEEFFASVGEGFEVVKLRCLDCDATALVSKDDNILDAKILCELCGGEMKFGLMPKCPKCGSRSTKMHKVTLRWD